MSIGPRDWSPLNRCGIDQSPCWSGPSRQRIIRTLLYRRQLDLAARSSISRSPRHTMSRSAPLACFHCHASHSFADSFRRLSSAWLPINCWIKVMSSSVMTLPRYFHTGMPECGTSIFGTQVLKRAHPPPHRRCRRFRIAGRQQQLCLMRLQHP